MSCFNPRSAVDGDELAELSMAWPVHASPGLYPAMAVLCACSRNAHARDTAPTSSGQSDEDGGMDASDIMKCCR